MKKNLLLIAIFLASFVYALGADDDTILVHITGFVEKPGSYQVASKITIEDLRKACGGLKATGTSVRMMVIRFPRTEGASEEHRDNPETRKDLIRKDEVLRLHEIPKDGKLLLLQDGDIIYVPEKYWIGR